MVLAGQPHLLDLVSSDIGRRYLRRLIPYRWKEDRITTPAAAELAARKVPFIRVTGYPGTASGGPVMMSAPRIAKPFTLEQLTEAMRKAFANAR